MAGGKKVESNTKTLKKKQNTKPLIVENLKSYSRVKKKRGKRSRLSSPARDSHEEFSVCSSGPSKEAHTHACVCAHVMRELTVRTICAGCWDAAPPDPLRKEGLSPPGEDQRRS